MSEITFTSCHGHCELSIESAKNCYTIQFKADGTQTMFLNCVAVHSWPKSKLCLPLVRMADKLITAIGMYLNTADTDTRNKLFWNIQDIVKGGE
jgi:hypothetical protein